MNPNFSRRKVWIGPLFRPTAFQYGLLTLLTFLAVGWLLLMTGYKEYWGFWQSPEVYGFLRKEYPQWQRDYVRAFHGPILVGTLVLYVGWGLTSLLQMRRTVRLVARRFYLFALVVMTFCLAFTIGVMGANNFINLLDRGELHGNTHLQLRQ